MEEDINNHCTELNLYVLRVETREKLKCGSAQPNLSYFFQTLKMTFICFQMNDDVYFIIGLFIHSAGNLENDLIISTSILLLNL